MTLRKKRLPSSRPGQSSSFGGYAGIEDLPLYVSDTYGEDYQLTDSIFLDRVNDFPQSIFEKSANNCTLTSLTRVLLFMREDYYPTVPANAQAIYEVVRDVFLTYGYDPKKIRSIRSRLRYGPWNIDRMCRDVLRAYGCDKPVVNNHYFFKRSSILSELRKNRPVLLNISFGDYANHTVTVVGCRIYHKEGAADRLFLAVYDGWARRLRYLDWHVFGLTPASVTVFAS